MTERTSHRGADRTTPIPTLPAPSGEIDALVRDLLEIVQEMAIESRSTIGTITAISGGELTVHIDDEQFSRTIGFSRALGVAYQVNDRVKLSLLRNDEYIVDGIVSSAETDRRVGRAQLGADAVGQEELGPFAVGWGNLATDVQNRITARPKVQTDDIATGAVTADKIGPNAVTRAKINNGAVGFDEIEGEAVGWTKLQGYPNRATGYVGTDVLRIVNYAKSHGWIPK